MTELYETDISRLYRRPKALSSDNGKRARFGVIVFPGSNCDQDTYYALDQVLSQDVEYVWHARQELDSYDCVILPGGFAHGDYLRTGAIARFSPIMESVARYAEQGGLVLGICNGFQILCEAGLLPGALRQNRGLRFLCKPVHIRVERADLPLSVKCGRREVLTMPIAHFEGSYFVDHDALQGLEVGGRVVFRYCDDAGEITDESNPNGSLGNIAGIANETGNVFGLMPHPERACEELVGSQSGKKLFESLVAWTQRNARERTA
jgi:phosphoribosylformylglycinamidine synthase I